VSLVSSSTFVRYSVVLPERFLLLYQPGSRPRSFSSIGRPDRDDVGAKCKTYLNMADDVMRLEQLMSSALSSIDMDMPAE
jgi:hypothetical protein